MIGISPKLKNFPKKPFKLKSLKLTPTLDQDFWTLPEARISTFYGIRFLTQSHTRFLHSLVLV